MKNETFKLIRLYTRRSQREFAEYIGTSLATVSAIEAGFRPVSSAVRAKLANKFTLDDAFFSYIENFRRLSQ